MTASLLTGLRLTRIYVECELPIEKRFTIYRSYILEVQVEPKLNASTRYIRFKAAYIIMSSLGGKDNKGDEKGKRKTIKMDSWVWYTIPGYYGALQ